MKKDVSDFTGVNSTALYTVTVINYHVREYSPANQTFSLTNISYLYSLVPIEIVRKIQATFRKKSSSGRPFHILKQLPPPPP